MVAFRYELIGQLNGGDALRLLPERAKGDQQQRMCGVKIVHGVGDQVRRWDRADIFPLWRDSQGAMISPIKAEVPAPVRTIHQIVLRSSRARKLSIVARFIVDVVE